MIGTKYADDPQIEKLKTIFFDARVQPHLADNDDPNLSGQLAPVSED